MKQSITPVHPLQSLNWEAFREKTGVTVVRTSSGLQLTIHRIPHTPWTVGYLPKGPLPERTTLIELVAIGKRERCIFIQLEPNVTVENGKLKMKNVILNSQFSILNSFHPLFTKYTFLLDLMKSEEELLKAMHPKTRYNIKVAQRHGVRVVEDNSQKAFKIYLRLLKETVKRQKFYAHDERYHTVMWETLKVKSSENELIAHLLIAKYKSEPLVAWILFVCGDTLYYPYGASSNKYKELMANNLMLWEAIRFGKKIRLKTFDLWGSLGPNPNKNDPWYGFHRFKEGYGGKLVEFVGSFDLVIHPFLYQLYKIADRIRWFALRIKSF